MLRTRSDRLELMDDPSIQGVVLEETLTELEGINRALFAYRPTLEGLGRLLRPGQTELSVLDVGAGGGDVARAMIDWGKTKGIAVTVRCIDLTDTTIAFARRRSEGYPGLSIERQDLFELPDRPEWDVVHAGQVLHHFPGDSATRAVAKMVKLARVGVVIHDLHRHPVAWAAIKVLTAAFSKNRLIKNDAPLSVLRGFTRIEWDRIALESGLPLPEVTWRLPFRWQVIFRASV